MKLQIPLKPKACVSFLYGTLSVGVVHFSHFCLLLQNHWVIFNPIWHKASLREGDSS